MVAAQHPCYSMLSILIGSHTLTLAEEEGMSQFSLCFCSSKMTNWAIMRSLRCLGNSLELYKQSISYYRLPGVQISVFSEAIDYTAKICAMLARKVVWQPFCWSIWYWKPILAEFKIVPLPEGMPTGLHRSLVAPRTYRFGGERAYATPYYPI